MKTMNSKPRTMWDAAAFAPNSSGAIGTQELLMCLSSSVVLRAFMAEDARLLNHSSGGALGALSKRDSGLGGFMWRMQHRIIARRHHRHAKGMHRL